jgi:hypothetical protein
VNSNGERRIDLSFEHSASCQIHPDHHSACYLEQSPEDMQVGQVALSMK